MLQQSKPAIEIDDVRQAAIETADLPDERGSRENRARLADEVRAAADAAADQAAR